MNSTVILILLVAVFVLAGIKKRKRHKWQRKYRSGGQNRKIAVYQKTKFDVPERSVEEKGEEGERLVASELERLPHDLFFVFNDVLLPTSDGTSQIDHVVVSGSGIFVVETKNYQGTIYGNEKSADWYQYLGGKKYPFHNPLHQNYGHLKNLSITLQLPESYFFPIAVFPNQTTLKTETTQLVLHNYEIKDYIQNYASGILLSEAQMNSARERLREVQLIHPEEKEEHVRQVKGKIHDRNEKIAMGICPQCGGKLVLRKGKYGSFYGCSQYPNCRYTVHEDNIPIKNQAE